MIWKIALVVLVLSVILFPTYLEIYARLTGKTLTAHDRAWIPFIFITTIVLSILTLVGCGLWHILIYF